VEILLDDRYQPDHDGVLHRGTYAEFPIGLQYIHLTSSYRDSGPTFDQVAISSYADESGMLLKRKLGTKSYVSAHRMEMLAYYEDDFTPGAAKIHELGLLVANMIGTSHFERVWLFSQPLDRVLAVWGK
jgi:hypothetical protein